VIPAAANSLHFPLLSIIIFLPALAGIICMLIEDVSWIRSVAVAAAVADFLLAMVLLARFELGPNHGAGPWAFQFEDYHQWVSSIGINYRVAVDGVSIFLVGLTTLIVGIALMASTFMIVDRVRAFMTLMLFLETAVIGVFAATNLFLFFVFWEAMLIPMYFLIGIWGEERRVYATTKFVVYTIFGSFLMLVGIFYLWSQTGTLDMTGTGGLVAQLTTHPLGRGVQQWLFLAFTLAFAIKLPIWPFHTWAPSAYSESPIPVVIVLSGILSKAGAFGLLRYCLPLFPVASRDFAGLISVLAIIGMLYAAGIALVLTYIKRLVAYASISHVNLIALGIFALNPTGLNGSVLQIINHSVIITGLFLAVAYIAARTGTRQLRDMGGLGERWPVLMWLFFVFVLAGLDLPGLSSFAGEFLILAGTFKSNAWFAGIAALTVILAAWYMIRFFQDSMNGPVTVSPQQAATATSPSSSLEGEDIHTHTPYQFPVVRLLSGDLLPREIALFVPLILLILYIGIQPDPLTTRMNGTTGPVTAYVHRASSVSTGVVGGGR
jgi:NADH-quinone oxidoreductase subunit M